MVSSVASERQIAANRRNAAKSTGPSTVEGKRLVEPQRLAPRALPAGAARSGQHHGYLAFAINSLERMPQPPRWRWRARRRRLNSISCASGERGSPFSLHSSRQCHRKKTGDMKATSLRSRI